MNENKAKNEPFDSDDMFRLLIMTFKTELLISISFSCVDAMIRIGFSIIFLYLLNAVVDGNYTIAYIYCSIEIILWHLCQVFKQGGIT